MKYRKVRSTLTYKEGYISLSYFLRYGMGLLEFIEDKWIKGYELPKGVDILE